MSMGNRVLVLICAIGAIITVGLVLNEYNNKAITETSRYAGEFDHMSRVEMLEEVSRLEAEIKKVKEGDYTSGYAIEDWTGYKAYVQKNGLMCDIPYIDDALILRRAGDRASLQRMIDRRQCLTTPIELLVTITKDAVRYTNPARTKIVINGDVVWVARSDLRCCYQ